MSETGRGWSGLFQRRGRPPADGVSQPVGGIGKTDGDISVYAGEFDPPSGFWVLAGVEAAMTASLTGTAVVPTGDSGRRSEPRMTLSCRRSTIGLLSLSPTGDLMP